FAELCTQYGVTSIEKVLGGYSKGYIQALTLWEQVLQLLQQLRLEKRMIILLLGHTEVKKIENPEVTAFDQFLPNLHHKASEKVRQWCDLVLFATREFGAAKGEKSGGERILRCVNSPMCVAKSRFQIPEILPMSWAALAAALYPKKEPAIQ
ncbi:MAG: AAA family ATPase, partial [Thermoguttaceae bacterium]